MRFLLICACPMILVMSAAALAQDKPAVSYTALSDAARKAGRLARYDEAPMLADRVRIDDYSLQVNVPKSARAYDVVPVRYKLSSPAGARKAAVEAVAFENESKSRGRDLYDMSIPGNLDVKIEYLGSVCADFDDASYIPLTPDGKSPVSPFPPVKRDNQVRSSTIRPAQAVWFRFRITNTGDTILDPEGFGAAFAEPVIRRFDAEGKEEWTAQPVNQRERFLQYLYPGESTELWTNFFCPKLGGKWNRGLIEGNYRVDFRLVRRWYGEYNFWFNIWGGREFARLEVPVKVAAQPAQTAVEPKFVAANESDTFPNCYESFEEFMSSFRVYRPSAKPLEHEGIVYLQVAPWTRHVAVKLVLSDPREIAVARLPIRITDETLQIRRNPANPMVVVDSTGREEPAFVAQAMPGMRTGFQLGPYPEEHMLQDIQEMKALGVNVIANTSGNWWIPEISGRAGVELHSACYKHFYDTLVRQAGMKLIGWSVYPPSSISWYSHVAPLLGRPVDFSKSTTGYVPWEPHSVDLGDPVVPEVIAAWTLFHYSRWGDLWFTAKDGRVPIDIEDTWGWMRDDINLRHLLGPLAMERFRLWVKARYTSIEKVNKAWSSNYASFEEIDPQSDQGVEGDNLSAKPVYNRDEHPFHDWSPAVEDWDLFRTELRMDIYRKALGIIRKSIPQAELCLRTEGANLVVPGDPESPNMHQRHIYFSQRRNAMVESVWDADVVSFHSDYTTLPYSEEEWRQAMRDMVKSGVTPVYLPQFDHMRDILLNEHYGRDYTRHYALDKPSKAMMVHCLMAAFPWWKAAYEEGGAPGILYSDYLCDGFATETQKREIRLLRDSFDRMK